MKRGRSAEAPRQRPLGLLIASALLLAACSPTRFAREPQPAADLSGQWILDPAASDDAAKMVAAITPKPRPWTARDRQAAAAAAQGAGGQGGQGGQSGQGGRGGRRGGRGDDQGGAAPAPVSDQLPAWGKVRPGDFIAAFALPPPRLEVAQQPTRVRVGADARRREFEPGDEQPFSVTDRYGSRSVSAGWRRDEFVISSRDGARLEVVEHYRHRADDHLELVVDFSARGLKSLSVHSLYRRATQAELDAPPADGPPAPPPR